MLIVQKFGGTSVADAQCIRMAARRITDAARQGNDVVAVVSAQGDTTDHLVSAAAAITNVPSKREMDAYLAAKLYAAVTPDTTALTSANILTTWDGYLEALTNARVNRDRVTAYLTPGTYKLLKEAAGLTRFVDTAEGFRGVDRNVARLDGVNIREVPADLMKSSYVFTEGWVAASGAKQINMILVDPDAVAAPVKYEVAMMSAPTAQSKGKYLYYERYYYGAFVLANRTAGVIVNANA